jgi:glycosyltransferase involved in cell wall biosynthesis
MRVLIDFTQIPIKKVGVGIYAMSLLKEISRLENESTFYVVVLNDDEEILNLLCSNPKKYKIIKVHKVFRKLALRFLLEQLYLPLLIFKYNIQTIHSLHYSFPFLPMPVKKVVTLHDMTFFLYPEFHKKLNVLFFKFMIRSSIKFCDTLICVSQSTKEDAFDILNIEESIRKKFIVVPLGTDFNLDYCPNKKTLNKYGLSAKNYFLFIGTLEPRKNIISVIDSYAKFCKTFPSYMKLVIVGKKGWNYDEIFTKVEYLKLQDKIIFTGYVDENEKKDLLWYSYFFLYPSFYEGFGMPVLESMAFGIPSITSNISSMPEVAGDAAILVNPKKIIEIFEAMALLFNDRDVYDGLIKKSLSRSKKFTWKKMAIDTLQVYLNN